MSYYERNLPHWLPEGKRVFVTWRLYGSLPVSVVKALRKNEKISHGKKFLLFGRALDKVGFGPSWLQELRIAAIAKAKIVQVAQSGFCVVHAYVVMPNHVHILLEPKVDLRKITRAIKGGSARASNLVLNRTGKPFWQDESFDHWIRDQQSFEKIRDYIERNPVSANLVHAPEAGNGRAPLSSTGFSLWPFRSATEKRSAERRIKNKKTQAEACATRFPWTNASPPPTTPSPIFAMA
jgi:REP element-mobilizing transposase RayT